MVIRSQAAYASRLDVAVSLVANKQGPEPVATARLPLGSVRWCHGRATCSERPCTRPRTGRCRECVECVGPGPPPAGIAASNAPPQHAIQRRAGAGNGWWRRLGTVSCFSKKQVESCRVDVVFQFLEKAEPLRLGSEEHRQYPKKPQGSIRCSVGRRASAAGLHESEERLTASAISSPET